MRTVPLNDSALFHRVFKNRPVLLDDGDALVAVDAFYNDSDKLLLVSIMLAPQAMTSNVYLLVLAQIVMIF